MEAWLVHSDHGKGYSGNLCVEQIWRFGHRQTTHMVRVSLNYDPGARGPENSSLYAYLLGPDNRDTALVVPASGSRWWIAGLNTDSEELPVELQQEIDKVIAHMKNVISYLPQPHFGAVDC